MCGIAGFFDKQFIKNNLNDNSILSIMKTRGPDYSNFFRDLNDKFCVTLYHSRLTIIDDNNRSNQPFKYKNFILTFNGEIYNFKALKDELKECGYSFFTESDTEVVVKAFDKWGESCFDKFDGMWALCIYDLKKKELILSRDFFGEKPLFYFKQENRLIFGSEIKYILSIGKNIPKIKEINEDQVNLYLKQGYRFLNKENNTFYKNIFSLNPGTFLKISENNFNFCSSKYYKNRLYNNQIKISQQEAIEETKRLVIDSLKSRLISDFPIGFYLSGGIDSGSLVSIAAKNLNQEVKCYSIIDKDIRYNEEKNISIIKKDINCKITKIKFPKKHNFLEKLQELSDYHDSPISTLSYYTHSFIQEHVKKDNVKVLISGAGGDEMFSGYYDHYLMHLREIKNKYEKVKNLESWKKYILPTIRNPNLKNVDLFKNIKNRNYLTSELNEGFRKKFIVNKSVKKFTENYYSKSLLRNRMLNELFHESVPILCHEDDLNSMKWSIENRSPYLNRKILKFTMSLPTNLFISDGYNKFLLRAAMKNILHDKVRLDRKKMGFNSSINSLISLKSNKLRQFLLKSKRIRDFINIDKFCDYLKKTRTISNNESKFIFNVINTATFLENR
jgi:asparagine synthase (glutamine-hydrolysing)